jgi:hypothetical protein
VQDGGDITGRFHGNPATYGLLTHASRIAAHTSTNGLLLDWAQLDPLSLTRGSSAREAYLLTKGRAGATARTMFPALQLWRSMDTTPPDRCPPGPPPSPYVFRITRPPKIPVVPFLFSTRQIDPPNRPAKYTNRPNLTRICVRVNR